MTPQDDKTGQLTHDVQAGATVPIRGGQATLQAKVYSPYQTYFEEEAYSISAVDDSGAFDILPLHHNFITLLRTGELTIASLHGPLKIRISGGLMHVHDNTVTVFLDV